MAPRFVSIKMPILVMSLKARKRAPLSSAKHFCHAVYLAADGQPAFHESGGFAAEKISLEISNTSTTANDGSDTPCLKMVLLSG